MTNGARVVFLGTPDFSVPILEALVEHGYDVPLVVTQPDKPTGRKQILTAPPVKQAALKLGIDVKQPVKVREIIEDLAMLEPDILLTAAYGQILPQRLLDLPRKGSLNVHASLLPRWRGAAPIHRAILAGDQMTGVTLMEMVRELDAGPMISTVSVAIGLDETVGTLHDKLSAAGARLLMDSLPDYLDGKLTAEPQPLEGITYAERILPEDERIIWSRAVTEVHNHIRGLSPWPGARTRWQGETFKLWLSRRLDPTDVNFPLRPPGHVCLTKAGHVAVACADGWLGLNTVQPAGKRRMNAADWMRGLPSDETNFEDESAH